MKKVVLAVFGLVLSFILTLTGPLAAAPTYYYQDLGSLPGESNCFAQDINNAGQVVGHGERAGYNKAFLKNPGQPLQDLGTLGGNYSYATSINDGGQVVGEAQDSDGKYWAFLKNPGQPDLQNLGTIPGGYTTTEAYGINNSGQVTGWVLNPDKLWRAFLKTPGDEMRDLGGLPGGLESFGWGINDAGQVVGSVYFNVSVSHAFVKNAALDLVDLGTLGGSWSVARSINNVSQIVGNSNNTLGQARAFLKNPFQDMQDLGTLGGNESWANDINNSGQVVGMARDGANQQRAFLWEESTMYDLNELTVNLPPGVQLIQAKAINDNGLIVGYANGDRSFLLTLTPPAGGSVPLGLLLE
jgi:probable HAF family extracellular repeat protein